MKSEFWKWKIGMGHILFFDFILWNFHLSLYLEPKFPDYSSSKFTSVYFSHCNGQTKKWIFTKLKYTKLQNKRQLFVKKQSQNSVSKYLFGAFCFCDFNSPFFRYKMVCVSCKKWAGDIGRGCGDIGSKIFCVLEKQFLLV